MQVRFSGRSKYQIKPLFDSKKKIISSLYLKLGLVKQFPNVQSKEYAYFKLFLKNFIPSCLRQKLKEESTANQLCRSILGLTAESQSHNLRRACWDPRENSRRNEMKDTLKIYILDAHLDNLKNSYS